MKRGLIFTDEDNVVASLRNAYNKRCNWIMLFDYLKIRADQELRKSLSLETSSDLILDDELQVWSDKVLVSEVVETVMFVGLPPDTPYHREARRKRREFVYSIGLNGIMVITRDATLTKDNNYKSNVDVLMSVRGMELVHNIKPDFVVIVTGDGDFAEMVSALREKGIKVFVAGIAESMSRYLVASANGSIDITPLIEHFPIVMRSDNDD